MLAIISNALGCSRGRCSAIGISGDYDYDGIVYIYNIEPRLDELLEQGLGLQTLAQYQMYLPIEQIIIPLPLTPESRSIPEKTVIRTVLSLSLRNIEHLGRRNSSRMVMSPLERFMASTPPSRWEPLVDKCSEAAYSKALKVLKNESDLVSAKNEMLRVLNGYRAECKYFNRDESIVEHKALIFNQSYKALAGATPKLDAVCFLKVRKNG